MRIFKRGSVYWVELVFDGKRKQRSTKARSQRLAGQVASAFHTALVKGDVGITARKKVPTFAEATKAFLKWSKGEHAAHPGTADRYRFSIAALLRFFGDVLLNEIAAEDVERSKQAAQVKRVFIQAGSFAPPP